MSDPIEEPLGLVLSHPPADPLDWQTYSTLLRYPMWNYLVQAVCSTRAYDDGLEAGFRLLAATEHHRCRMSAATHEQNLRMLYLFLLAMLDKADRWEEYLAAWQSIRDNTSLSLTYSFEALEDHGPRIEPFVLSGLPERPKAISDGGPTALARTGGVQASKQGTTQPEDIRVHFLYLQEHRREVIERKLARQRAGRPVMNLLHARREALTCTEVRERLAWIGEVARQHREGT